MASDHKESHAQQAPVQLNIGIKDALDLIPEYSGKSDTEFIHFRVGCEDACELLGPQHGKTLLKFLKLKLKGLAYARYATLVSSSPDLTHFLDVVQTELCGAIHTRSHWEGIIKGIRQEVGESARDYGARMEEVLACAWIALGQRPSLMIYSAIREFKRNMISERIRDYVNDPDDNRGDIIDAVLAAEQWLEVYEGRIKCKICNSIDHTDDKCCRVKNRNSPYKGGLLLGDPKTLKKWKYDIRF